MVRHAMKYCVNDAAYVYGRTRKTVRKWCGRFDKKGLKGFLEDRSRRPHHSPNRTSPGDRAKIIRLKKKTHFGAERLHNEFGVKQ